MDNLIIASFFIGLAAGYYTGQQSLIKFHRRLYNLNTDFNRLYVEYTERDVEFNEYTKPENKIHIFK